MQTNLPKKLLLSEIKKIENTLKIIKKKYFKNFDKLCYESLKTIKKKKKNNL